MFVLRNNNEEVVPCVPIRIRKWNASKIINLHFVPFSYSTSQQMSRSETIRKITYAYITLQLFSRTSSLRTTECIEIKFSSKLLVNTPEYV